jgi:hypothetical protein
MSAPFWLAQEPELLVFFRGITSSGLARRLVSRKTDAAPARV